MGTKSISEKEKMIRLINIYANFNSVYESNEYIGRCELKKEILNIIQELKECRSLKNIFYIGIYEDIKQTVLDMIGNIRLSFL